MMVSLCLKMSGLDLKKIIRNKNQYITGKL